MTRIDSDGPACRRAAGRLLRRPGAGRRPGPDAAAGRRVARCGGAAHRLRPGCAPRRAHARTSHAHGRTRGCTGRVAPDQGRAARLPHAARVTDGSCSRAAQVARACLRRAGQAGAPPRPLDTPAGHSLGPPPSVRHSPGCAIQCRARLAPSLARGRSARAGSAGPVPWGSVPMTVSIVLNSISSAGPVPWGLSGGGVGGHRGSRGRAKALCGGAARWRCGV